MHVIKQRRIRNEAFLAHELLGVQVPIRTAESDMTLTRNLSGDPVVRHVGSFATMFVQGRRSLLNRRFALLRGTCAAPPP
jgi:hypothetical protein